MKLYEKGVSLALRHFIKEIEPAAFSWRMISVEFKDTESIDTNLFQKLHAQALQENFEKLECHIFRLKRGRLLMIFFQGRARVVEKSIESFLQALRYVEIDVILDVLDLSIEWSSLTRLTQHILPEEEKIEAEDAEAEEALLHPQEEEKEEEPEPPPEENKLAFHLDPERIRAMNPTRQARFKPIILLVEDDPLFQKLVKVSLPEYEIITVETAWQSLVYYQRYLPNIVFLDINLPDGNGLGVLSQITDADKDSYIIMISADAHRDKIIHAQEHGAKNFIAKPFTRKRLLDVLADFTARHKRNKP